MGKLKDVVAVTGKYQKDGEEKAEFTNCGAIIESNGKQYLKIKVMPAPTVGKDGVSAWWFNLYEPQAKTADKPAAKPAAKTDFNDDLDF